MAKWMKRPILRASFLSTKACTSKSLTSAAMRTEWPVRSKAVISAMPLFPASRPSHICGAVFPTPQRRPMPVTTTRRWDILLSFLVVLQIRSRPSKTEPKGGLLSLLVLLDVLGRVLDGLDLLRVLIRDLDVEGFFELHHELDDVERVGAEVFLEAGAGGDFGFIHLKLLDNNLLNLLINCCHLAISYEVLGWARDKALRERATRLTAPV